MKIDIPILTSQIHIGKRTRLRHVEDKREVPLILIGSVCVSYWTAKVIQRERKFEMAR